MRIRRFRYWRVLLKSILITLLGVILIINYVPLSYYVTWGKYSLSIQKKYLIYSPKCKILNLKPRPMHFKPEKYKRCMVHPAELTYLRQDGDLNTIFINYSVLSFYTESSIYCCLKVITRLARFKSEEGNIMLSRCRKFTNYLSVKQNLLYVECRDGYTQELIYNNVHFAFDPASYIKVNEPIFEQWSGNSNTMSVLIIGLGYVSRYHFSRALPETKKFLDSNDWTQMNGYNQVTDKTFPNLMALLSGMNRTRYRKSCYKNSRTLDKCPFIWDSYRTAGYITAVGEDNALVSPLHSDSAGFQKPPAHFYFRPYFYMSNKINSKKSPYCSGYTTSGERMFDIIRSFAIPLKDEPHFGFFWMDSFTYQVNVLSRMDLKLKQLFEHLTDSGALKSTMVLFLSDSGTKTSQLQHKSHRLLEERLPFLYIYIPESFKELNEWRTWNVAQNSRKLISPYDLYQTLQHNLFLQGHQVGLKPCRSCPHCDSIFNVINLNRSCADIGIPLKWCSCNIHK